MADQNRFCSAKCSNWSENGQWPAVISSTANIHIEYICTIYAEIFAACIFRGQAIDQIFVLKNFTDNLE